VDQALAYTQKWELSCVERRFGFCSSVRIDLPTDKLEKNSYVAAASTESIVPILLNMMAKLH